jgi:hypothetical protein
VSEESDGGDDEADAEAIIEPISRVRCPTCGVGGEVADSTLIGSAVCGDSAHPEVLLVPA